jgi:DNA-binding CsgD family transcriptional regulator
MIAQIALSWPRINDFLLDCGKICHPRDFSIHLLKKLNSLVPYDEGMVCFFDNTGAVIDEFLLNIDPQIIWDYKEYYSKVEDGRYSISVRARTTKESIHDWTTEKHNEFVTHYIRPQSIRYSFGLGLYDANDAPKSTCIINRIGKAKYSDAEMGIMAAILPHLRNLYRNFFFDTAENCSNTDSALSGLTARESEIVAQLCNGSGPALISRKLFISRPTVYRHIANIYGKLNVSSLQELLVKAYNHPATLPSRQA